MRKETRNAYPHIKTYTITLNSRKTSDAKAIQALEAAKEDRGMTQYVIDCIISKEANNGVSK